MSDIKVSIFASAVRFQFFETFLSSLVGTTEKIEVVFGGPCTIEEVKPFIEKYNFFKYIHTGNIKPAQVYECTRRACGGETIAWSADDCIMTPDFYGKAYRHWKSLNNELIALSLQTEENGQFCNMKVHSFFGGHWNTPLMAPLALMSNKVANDMGGFDRRYVCGQYENDCIMRLIELGGRVEIFGSFQDKIIIDHYARHGIKRPFATGYNHDREILEGSWTDGRGKVFLNIQRPFEPYEDEGLTTTSQSFKGQWE